MYNTPHWPSTGQSASVARSLHSVMPGATPSAHCSILMAPSDTWPTLAVLAIPCRNCFVFGTPSAVYLSRHWQNMSKHFLLLCVRFCQVAIAKARHTSNHGKMIACRPRNKVWWWHAPVQADTPITQSHKPNRTNTHSFYGRIMLADRFFWLLPLMLSIPKWCSNRHRTTNS